MGSSLEGMNLLQQEQILSFKGRPHLERTSLPRKLTRKQNNCFPLKKNGDKHGFVPICLYGDLVLHS